MAENYIDAENDYMLGMKYKDIAAKYGVTINTVKSWKQRYSWSKVKEGVHTKEEKVCTQKEGCMLKALDLSYSVLYSDLDKAQKIVLVNELLCEFDEQGNPKLSKEQKEIFVFTGEKLPEEKGMIQEYNPIIRIDEITKAFELNLSLLSMLFGYGTKKYSFENGQITTATEYIGERQDQMQELNRQRQEATRYIQDICKAIMWFSNTFHGTSYNLDKEILVDFDDSYVTDKESELERKRNDALSFEIPELSIWYLTDAYSLTEEEARALVEKKQEEEEQNADGEEED